MSTDFDANTERSSVLSFTATWKRLWPLALFSRLIVVAVGLAAVVTVGPKPDNRPPSVSANVVVDLTSRWDVGWYIGLASRGYDRERIAEKNDRTAFFPAWPLTLRAAAQVVPRTSAAWAWIGAAVSILLFSAALAQTHRVAQTYLPVERADDAALLLAVYPFSIYFSVAYSESLYLLAISSAWLSAVERRQVRAVAWGTLVGLTRPNGLTLFLPLLLARGRPTRLTVRTALVTSVGPLLGVLLFSTFLWIWVGVPWQWLAAQDSWGRAHVGLFGLASADANFLQHNGFYGLLTGRPYDLFNMLGLIPLLLTPWVYKHLGLGAALVAPCALLPALAVGGWPSFGRYSSVAFPAFIAVAAMLERRYVPVLAACGAMLAGLAATLFFTSRPLY